MTTTTNRYAPPKAVVDDRPAEAGMWREGQVLVMRKGGAFPDRCIKCNAPSVAPRRRYRLSWHSPWLYLLILLALLLYALVAAIVRKTAIVHLGLCERHQKRVFWGRLIGWGGLVLEVALVWAAAALHEEMFALAALVLAVPWLIGSVLVNRLVLPQRIDDKYVRLKGCGPDFLRSLPERGGH
ncbi:MAG: hypothetical protein JF586_08935 [Burkholderiales bacterium]|nr:hypothetical protein [Burkholderiales bacterium]